MPVLQDLLSGIDRAKRSIGRNLSDLLSNPAQYLEMLDDQAKNYNQNVQPTIQGGQLLNRPLTEQEVMDKHTQMAMDMQPGAIGKIVYHGSPHKFDKFSLDKIGTGEGAQAYGHGLYFAENRKVAEGYRDALGQAYDNDDPILKSALAAIDKHGNADKAAKAMKEADAWQYADEIDTLEHWAKHPENIPSWRNLYKTDIPDEAVARFLDWDKPLSQQAPEVQKALDLLRSKAPKGSLLPEMLAPLERNATTGEAINRRLAGDAINAAHVGPNGEYVSLPSSFNEYAVASEALRKAGIPGIRYLDGGSRSAGQGSSNFVIFDPEMIRILERNGQATGLQPWKPGEYRPLNDLLDVRKD